MADKLDFGYKWHASVPRWLLNAIQWDEYRENLKKPMAEKK